MHVHLSWLEISESAITHNYNVFASLLGKEHVAPVVKANAYGHGIKEVFQILAPLKPTWLCTNYVEEAQLLRKLGFTGRILVVGPQNGDSLDAAAKENLDVFVGAQEVLDTWMKMSQRPRAHIKFDTGMSRQGFLPEQVGTVCAALRPHVADVAGVCTHFSNVEDVTEQKYSLLQLKKFDDVLQHFRSAGFTKILAHTAASAACLIMKGSRHDLGRVGISLYGQWPSQATRISFLQMHQNLVDLQPALSWRTRITTLKPVEAGSFIGYGCTFRAHSRMQIAVLPVGYFEGMPRAISNAQSYVLIRGQRCQVVGRICMNMMMVDVTHLKDAKVGDLVTLIGQDQDEYLHANDVATWAQTIHYEILSRIHPDIERVIVK